MDKIRNLSSATKSNLITYGMVIVAYVVMQCLVSAGAISNSMVGLLVPICSYICMAISLNLVVGISGELSLGHAGFMSVGAFTGLVVASCLRGVVGFDPLRLAIAIMIAGAFAALAGILVGLPVMRLRGDYLAIVTLAFGEIIKNLLNNLYVGLDTAGLHFSMVDAKSLGMQGGTILINGPQGAAGIDKLSSFTAGFVLIIVTLFVVLNLVNSRTGRAIMAVRDNRIAAESVGINTMKYRLIAFVVSAALAGMAGALYAMNFSSIVPKKFDFNTSILVLVFVVLGGMGNIRGGIISAALLTILPERLRFLGDFRMLIYAVVLIAVMIASNNTKAQEIIQTVKSRLRRKGDDEAALAANANEGGAAGE
ncbi:MAG: branched-chain amino acid ABC transporter permease [Coriobacteriales bacterium]|nr:branched-chain amino acid ABC transporter permease [Coriobacteriales bacterium]